MKSACVTNHYAFHGLGIAISAEPQASAVLHSRFNEFTASCEGSLDLVFEVTLIADQRNHVVKRPPGRARPVYEPKGGVVLYIKDEDYLYINYGDRVRILCQPARGYARVSVLQSEVENLWLASHSLFTVALIEMLKRRGLYSIHASGLCIDGRGLLFAGTSGAGKSTLAIALLRAGFGFMGDDMLFLASDAEGLRVLAFPDEIDVADETARLFPELNFLLDMPRPTGRLKRQIRAEEICETDPVWECRPAVVVFPEVVNAEESSLHPMSRDEALMELVPNVLLTEARSCQAHLDILGKLARGSECYRLRTGRDIGTLPVLLLNLVQ